MRKEIFFLAFSVLLALSVVPVSAIDTSNWVPGVKPGDYAEYKIFEVSMNGVSIDLNIYMKVTVTEVRNNSYDWFERIIGDIEYTGNILGYVQTDREENVPLGWIIMPINLKDGEVIDSGYYSAAGEGINITAGHNITVHYAKVMVHNVEFDAFYVEYSWNLTVNNESYSYTLRAYYHKDSGFLLKFEYYLMSVEELSAQQTSTGFGYEITKSNKVPLENNTIFLVIGVVVAIAIVGAIVFILIKRRAAQKETV